MTKKKQAANAKRSARRGEPDTPRSDRRDHLVQTALQLFYRNGFHATGIDTILSEAGVAKMTLYKHFPCKDDLIVAALELRDDNWMTLFRNNVEARSNTPRGRLLAVFDALDDWFNGRMGDNHFCGCAFTNVAAEYLDPDHPIHRCAADHKQRVEQYMKQLAAEAKLRNPQQVARHLSLLIEGAIVQAHVMQRRDAAQTAKQAARTLLKT